MCPNKKELYVKAVIPTKVSFALTYILNRGWAEEAKTTSIVFTAILSSMTNGGKTCRVDYIEYDTLLMPLMRQKARDKGRLLRSLEREIQKLTGRKPHHFDSDILLYYNLNTGETRQEFANGTAGHGEAW